MFCYTPIITQHCYAVKTFFQFFLCGGGTAERARAGQRASRARTARGSTAERAACPRSQRPKPGTRCGSVRAFAPRGESSADGGKCGLCWAGAKGRAAGRRTRPRMYRCWQEIGGERRRSACLRDTYAGECDARLGAAPTVRSAAAALAGLRRMPPKPTSKTRYAVWFGTGGLHRGGIVGRRGGRWSGRCAFRPSACPAGAACSAEICAVQRPARKNCPAALYAAAQRLYNKNHTAKAARRACARKG